MSVGIVIARPHTASRGPGRRVREIFVGQGGHRKEYRPTRMSSTSRKGSTGRLPQLARVRSGQWVEPPKLLSRVVSFASEPVSPTRCASDAPIPLVNARSMSVEPASEDGDRERSTSLDVEPPVEEDDADDDESDAGMNMTLAIQPDVDLKVVFSPGASTGTFEVIQPQALVDFLTARHGRQGARGVTSPPHAVTLASPPPASSETEYSRGERAEAGVPVGAASFCFCYPLPENDVDMQEMLERRDLALGACHFLLLGGFVYFDAVGVVLQCNAISDASGSAQTATYGAAAAPGSAQRPQLRPSPAARTSFQLLGPHSASDAATATLDEQARLVPTTLEPLRHAGFVRFAWVNPNELPGGHALAADDERPTSDAPPAAASARNHGAFLYEYIDERGKRKNLFYRLPRKEPQGEKLHKLVRRRVLLRQLSGRLRDIVEAARKYRAAQLHMMCRMAYFTEKRTLSEKDLDLRQAEAASSASADRSVVGTDDRIGLTVGVHFDVGVTLQLPPGPNTEGDGRALDVTMDARNFEFTGPPALLELLEAAAREHQENQEVAVAPSTAPRLSGRCGVMSPRHEIFSSPTDSISMSQRRHAGIPAAASYFTFVYPNETLRGQMRRERWPSLEAPQLHLLYLGGFAYFNHYSECIQVG